MNRLCCRATVRRGFTANWLSEERNYQGFWCLRHTHFAEVPPPFLCLIHISNLRSEGFHPTCSLHEAVRIIPGLFNQRDRQVAGDFTESGF